MRLIEIAAGVAEAKDYKMGCHLSMLLAFCGTGVILINPLVA